MASQLAAPLAPAPAAAAMVEVEVGLRHGTADGPACQHSYSVQCNARSALGIQRPTSLLPPIAGAGARLVRHHRRRARRAGRPAGLPVGLCRQRSHQRGAPGALGCGAAPARQPLRCAWLGCWHGTHWRWHTWSCQQPCSPCPPGSLCAPLLPSLTAARLHPPSRRAEPAVWRLPVWRRSI